MELIIQNELTGCNTLPRIEKILLQFFEKEKFSRLGYAPGIISSDGREYIERNRKRLIKITRDLEKEYKIPIFCASDVLNENVIQQIHKHANVQDFIDFWRSILASKYITDVYMTPGWEKSNGARDEHQTAKKLGLKIYYL